MKKLLLVTLLFAGLFVKAQDVTGIWRGSFYGQQSKLMEMMGEEDKYKFEVQLAQTDKKFEGVTYSYKTTVFYGKASCEGTVNAKNGKVLLDELKLLELKVMQGNSACVMSCRLQYSRNGNEEFMEGTYESFNNIDSSNCGKGTIFLRKVVTSDFYKEPFVIANEKRKLKNAPKIPATAALKPSVKTTPPGATKPPAAKPPATKPGTKNAGSDVAVKPVKPASGTGTAKNTKPATKPTTKPTTGASSVKEVPSTAKLMPKPVEVDIEPPEPVKKPIVVPKVLSTRENELVKTIYSGEGTISINIYDNGTVDNDTVSVYLNNKLVLSKKRLTEKPLTLKFDLDNENAEQELVMVAENLGEIPPNTSLMVVSAGDKKYEVRITSTEQKNAVIVFRLKK